MYPPPDASIIGKLVGCTVDSLSFFRFQIVIFSAEGPSLIVRSPFCFGSDYQIEEMDWIDFPVTHTDITRILGSKITCAAADNAHHLRIGFSTGDALLVSWTSMYESYELHIEGQRIIV